MKTITFKWISLVGFIVMAGLLVSLIWLLQTFTGSIRLLEQADEAFWRTQFSEAEMEYSRVLETSRLAGQRIEAYTGLCRLYGYKGDFALALDNCEAAVGLTPDDPEPRAQLARTYTWMGNYDRAILEGQAALQLEGQCANAAAFLAEAIVLQMDAANEEPDFAHALSISQYALELDRSNAEVYRVMGLVYQLQGNLDESAVYYQKALQSKPDFFSYYIDLGIVEADMKNGPAALEAFNSALQLYPESVQAFQERGWMWWSQGEYDQARSDFQQAIILDEQDAASWAGLGWAYLDAGSTEEALWAFEQALSLDPEDSDAGAGLESLNNQTMLEE
jgi:tetratricopeptide (TPR) repeat protein